MKEYNVQKIHDGDRYATLKTVGKQYAKIYNKHLPTIECPCGREYRINNMFKCLYCEVFFCRSCAKEHFGQSREKG